MTIDIVGAKRKVAEAAAALKQAENNKVLYKTSPDTYRYGAKMAKLSHAGSIAKLSSIQTYYADSAYKISECYNWFINLCIVFLNNISALVHTDDIKNYIKKIKDEYIGKRTAGDNTVIEEVMNKLIEFLKNDIHTTLNTKIIQALDYLKTAYTNAKKYSIDDSSADQEDKILKEADANIKKAEAEYNKAGQLKHPEKRGRGTNWADFDRLYTEVKNEITGAKNWINDQKPKTAKMKDDLKSLINSNPESKYTGYETTKKTEHNDQLKLLLEEVIKLYKEIDVYKNGVAGKIKTHLTDNYLNNRVTQESKLINLLKASANSVEYTKDSNFSSVDIIHLLELYKKVEENRQKYNVEKPSIEHFLSGLNKKVVIGEVNKKYI